MLVAFSLILLLLVSAMLTWLRIAGFRRRYRR